MQRSQAHAGGECVMLHVGREAKAAQAADPSAPPMHEVNLLNTFKAVPHSQWKCTCNLDSS